MADSDILRKIREIVAPGEFEVAQTLSGQPSDGTAIVESLVKSGALTGFQAEGISRGAFAALRIGNYDILDRLGAGGMGTVFKARHRRMRRVVALKVLARNLCDDPLFVQRFHREVETLAKLAHPNIVMAFDADEAEVGHFLVMELVDGADLATIAARERIPVGKAVRAIADAARGLEYAHRQGFVHRDIKPANLLRDASGIVKVADLGLARPAEKTGNSNSGLTQAGGILGTVDYMSPEQAVDSTSLGPAADIYSLGASFYFLLTAKPPYKGANFMSTLMLHAEAPIPDIRKDRPDVPPRLANLITRMLGKKPADRPASMREVETELEAIEAELATESGPVEFDLGPATTFFSGGAGELAAGGPLPRAEPKPISVVLVEPSRTQASIVKRCLEAVETSAVEVFGTGAEALAALAARPADIVVSAMHLKDMTGVDLARAVREKKGPATNATAPGFLLITSSSESSDAAGLSSAGLALSLPKPFTPVQLAEALSRAAGFAVPRKAMSSESELSLAGMTPPKHSSSVVKPPRAAWRILVVDDSSPARMHVRATLEQLGFRHFTDAADGAQAVAAAAREKFDLIVTDYNMPYMDGAALVGYLRANPSTAKTPIVMVTTETAPEKLDPVRRLDVAGIIEKSFPVDAVRRIIEKLG